jgi:pimeloyl-ACP methyl ester carboxylesterase
VIEVESFPQESAMLERIEPSISRACTVVLQSGRRDNNEALVFVHGNPGFPRDWEDLMARAGAFCRYVAPDMPGFGHSDKPETFDYTVGGYARHLGALLTQLDVRRAHLMLHDFGGPWELAWTLCGVLAGYR